MNLNINLTPEVQYLIKNIGMSNIESYLNDELTMALKNRIYGRCYFTIRLPKKVTERVEYLKEKTGLHLTKVLLFALY
jgi:hypothetical protein